jgi:hypothetical protein
MRINKVTANSGGHAVYDAHYLRPPKTGVGNLFITAGSIDYSYLCRGPREKIDVMDSNRNCISLTQRA